MSNNIPFGKFGFCHPHQFEPFVTATDTRAKLGSNAYFYNHLYNYPAYLHQERGYIPMLFTPSQMADPAFSCVLNHVWGSGSGAEVGRSKFWLVLNEPEHESYSVQDAVDCVRTLEDTHGITQYAIPGVSVTDNGLAWLAAYLDTPGRPTPPYFHIHIYHAQTPTQWDAQWQRFRDVVVPRGLGYIRTIVSETNVWNNSASDAKALMSHVESRIVRQWPYGNAGPMAAFWFASWYSEWGWPASLFYAKKSGNRYVWTSVGNHFAGLLDPSDDISIETGPPYDPSLCA